MNTVRSYRALLALTLPALSAASAGAQQKAPHAAAQPPAASKPAASPKSALAKPQSVMQLQIKLPDALFYRFLDAGQDAAALLPLPAPSGAQGIVTIPIPAAAGKTSELEIDEPAGDRTARFPVQSAAVTPVTDSSFTLVRNVYVPVHEIVGSTDKGPVSDELVLLKAKGAGTQTFLLNDQDRGVARFSYVPIGTPVTVTVWNGPNSINQTQTIQPVPNAVSYNWPVIAINTPGVILASLPAAASAASAPPAVPAPPPASSPVNSFISLIVGLAAVGGLGYGIYRYYENGKLKTVLQTIGVTQPEETAAVQPSPFDSKAKAPITPITEGTADPLGMGAGDAGGAYSPSAASAGPRLIGSAGTFAGSIFPIVSPQTEIGRDASNPISLSLDTNVSRRHALIQAQNGQTMLMDTGSANGTFLNGVRIPANVPQPLQQGDEVQIGMTRFRFEM